MGNIKVEVAMSTNANPRPATSSHYIDWERHLRAPASVLRCKCQCHDIGEPWCLSCELTHMHTNRVE